MSKSTIHPEDTTAIDSQFAELFGVVRILEAKFPEHFLIGDGVRRGKQPCGREFTTVGLSASQGLTKDGFDAAYMQAENLAQTICNTGDCKKLEFQGYENTEIVEGKKYRLTIAWKCVKS